MACSTAYPPFVGYPSWARLFKDYCNTKQEKQLRASRDSLKIVCTDPCAGGTLWPIWLAGAYGFDLRRVQVSPVSPCVTTDPTNVYRDIVGPLPFLPSRASVAIRTSWKRLRLSKAGNTRVAVAFFLSETRHSLISPRVS